MDLARAPRRAPLTARKKGSGYENVTVCDYSSLVSHHRQSLGHVQPRTQALSTTRLAGGKTLVQAGHVSPRFWEITNFLHKGGGLSSFYRSSCRYQFDKVQSVCILTNACIILTNGKSLCCKING